MYDKIILIIGYAIVNVDYYLQIMIYRGVREARGDAGDAISAFLKKSLAKNFLAGL